MPAKHFQLLVPNYSAALYTYGQAPLSYLRLGAAFSSSDDATLPSSERGHEWIEAQLTATGVHFFKDDERYANGWERPDTTYRRYDGVDDTPVANPRTLTAELLTRGGWYEHTDGNRLSTTRGDHLEVVGGNYRMVVLGRVRRDPSAPTTAPAAYSPSHWESSGGHNHATTSTPGETVTVKWDPNVEAGTWEATTITSRANVVNYYEGRQESYSFGPSKSSYQGPGTGSSFNAERPVLRSEVYANTTKGKTTVGSTTTTTTIEQDGSQTSAKCAPKIESRSDVTFKKSTTWSANAETKHAFDTRVEVSIGMAKMGVAMGVDSTTQSHFSGVKMSFDLHKLSTTIEASASASVKLGGGLSLSVPLAKSDEYTLAVSFDVKLAMIVIGSLSKLLVAYCKMKAEAMSAEGAQDMARAHAIWCLGPM